MYIISIATVLCEMFSRLIFTGIYDDWRRTKTTDDRFVYIIIILPIYRPTKISSMSFFVSFAYRIISRWTDQNELIIKTIRNRQVLTTHTFYIYKNQLSFFFFDWVCISLYDCCCAQYILRPYITYINLYVIYIL